MQKGTGFGEHTLASLLWESAGGIDPGKMCGKLGINVLQQILTKDSTLIIAEDWFLTGWERNLLFLKVNPVGAHIYLD